MRRSASVLALAGLALTTGCADGRDPGVEESATAFGRALRAADSAQACAVLAPLTREELESQGQSCPAALEAQGLLEPTGVGSLHRFGREARVVVEDAAGRTDTWFLSRFDDRWLVVAAGCLPRSQGLPYDCDVEGA